MVDRENWPRTTLVGGCVLLVAAVLFFSFGGWGSQHFAFYVTYRDHSKPVNGSGVMDWRYLDGSEEHGRVQVTIADGVGMTSLPVGREKMGVTQVRLTTVDTDRGPGLGGGWRRLTDVTRHVRLEIRAGKAKPREWFARAIERARAVVEAGAWSGRVLTDSDRELIRDAIEQLRSETADHLPGTDLVALFAVAAQVNQVTRIGFNDSVFVEADRRAGAEEHQRMIRASRFLSDANVEVDAGGVIAQSWLPRSSPAERPFRRWFVRQHKARLSSHVDSVEEWSELMARADAKPAARGAAILRRTRLAGAGWSPDQQQVFARIYRQGRAGRQVSQSRAWGEHELAPIVHDLQFELAEAAMPAIRDLDDEALLADAERDRRLLRLLGPVINIGAVARAARVDLREVTTADYRTSTNVSLWRALEALAVSGEPGWIDLVDEVTNGR